MGDDREPAADEPPPRFFELSIYTPAPGRQAELLERFRRHTLRLFERHGMTNIGYWLSDERPARLYYLLSHPSREAAADAWHRFGADPEWQEVYQASMVDGSLICDHRTIPLSPTDFSPLR